MPFATVPLDACDIQARLIDQVYTQAEDKPRFAVFLGAGASVTSGVPASHDMANIFYEHLRKLWESNPTNLEELRRIRASDQAYGELFGRVADTPAARRIMVEKNIGFPSPSIGYFFLTKLIDAGLFRVFFTTNFDDLLNDACRLFGTAPRPVVCAHDDAAESVGQAGDRAIIYKLHGDFLFDSLRVTPEDTKRDDPRWSNMAAKLKQDAQRLGLLVIGYAGADESVMTLIEEAAATPHGFPAGIRWCLRKGAPDAKELPVHQRVLDLKKKCDGRNGRPTMTIAAIDGFDEFFAALHAKWSDGHPGRAPEEFVRPYQAVARRLNRLDVSGMANINGRVRTEISRLHAALREQPMERPYRLMARLAVATGDVELAVEHLVKAIELEPSMDLFRDAYKHIAEYAAGEQSKKPRASRWRRALSRFLKDKVIERAPYRMWDLFTACVRLNDLEEAQRMLKRGYSAYTSATTQGLDPKWRPEVHLINTLLLKRLRKQILSDEDREQLLSDSVQGKKDTRMAALILLERPDEAAELLQNIIDDDSIPRDALQTWPILGLLRGALPADSKWKRSISAGLPFPEWGFRSTLAPSGRSRSRLIERSVDTRRRGGGSRRSPKRK